VDIVGSDSDLHAAHFTPEIAFPGVRLRTLTSGRRLTFRHRSIAISHQKMFDADIFVQIIPMQTLTIPAENISCALLHGGVLQAREKLKGIPNVRPSTK